MPIINHSPFDKLLKRNVPHILEDILLYLNYETFLACPEVCCAFSDVLASESFRKKAKSVFAEEIRVDKIKLCDASWKGDAEEVKWLLSNLRSIGSDINFETSRKGAPLHNAAKKGHEVVVKLLLGAGADPNITGREGTPLHMAVKFSYPNVARLFLNAGADPNKRGRYGYYPLISAAMCQAFRPKKLKNHGQQMVRMLINAGADPNGAQIVGWTPLHYAAMDGKSGIVKFLLEAGADPNRASDNDGTPLHVAAIKGRGSVVKELLGAGADQNADKWGGGSNNQTFLQTSYVHGTLACVRWPAAATVESKLAPRG